MATPGQNGAQWLKLHLATFDDPRWLIIESFPELADPAQVIYIRLLILAGKCNAGGLLLLPGGKPYGEDELAAVLRRKPTTVKAVLQMLEAYGFVEWVGDPPTLTLLAWHEQDVDALALLAERRQKDAERKRIKRSEINHLPVSADTSADVPRNVRAQSKKKRKIKTTATPEPEPAAADLPQDQDQNPTSAPHEILAAIDLLPAGARPDCLAVAVKHQHLQVEVLASNIKLLASRLASLKSKPIPRPGGWLVNALEHDLAAPERQAQAETQAAKAQAAQRRQEETEREERERLEELQRQRQLLLLLEGLDPVTREQIEAQAAEKMRQIGAEGEQVRQAYLLAATEEHISGRAA